VVISNHVRVHGEGIRDHQIKIKEVVTRVWARWIELMGGLR